MKTKQISTMPELLGFLQGAGTSITASQAATMIQAATATIYTGDSEQATEVVRGFLRLIEAYPPPAELPLFFDERGQHKVSSADVM